MGSPHRCLRQVCFLKIWVSTWLVGHLFSFILHPLPPRCGPSCRPAQAATLGWVLREGSGSAGCRPAIVWGEVRKKHIEQQQQKKKLEGIYWADHQAQGLEILKSVWTHPKALCSPVTQPMEGEPDYLEWPSLNTSVYQGMFFSFRKLH